MKTNNNNIYNKLTKLTHFPLGPEKNTTFDERRNIFKKENIIQMNELQVKRKIKKKEKSFQWKILRNVGKRCFNDSRSDKVNATDPIKILSTLIRLNRN